jgi:hypothetical protein
MLYASCIHIFTFISLKSFSVSSSHLNLCLPIFCSTFWLFFLFWKIILVWSSFDIFYSHSPTTPNFNIQYSLPGQKVHMIPSVTGHLWFFKPLAQLLALSCFSEMSSSIYWTQLYSFMSWTKFHIHTVQPVSELLVYILIVNILVKILRIVCCKI